VARRRSIIVVPMTAPSSVEVVARLGRAAGAERIEGGQEAFDYACGKARAEAIDELVISVFDERGWSMFDDALLVRVVVQHEGETRARVLVDGQPATAWWHDRLVETADQVTWCFVPEG
jgi:hypothetical protein